MTINNVAPASNSAVSPLLGSTNSAFKRVSSSNEATQRVAQNILSNLPPPLPRAGTGVNPSSTRFTANASVPFPRTPPPESLIPTGVNRY